MAEIRLFGSRRIWRPLAENGDADAASTRQAYRLGRGVPLNLGAAQSWFERAACKDHVDAETTLGLLLFQNGNQTGGMRWLKGPRKGDARAMLVYGTAFNGDAVPQDPILGYAYVSRAAAQGLGPAKETAQMDQILPLEDRKKGLVLALAKVKAQRGQDGGKPPPPSPRPPSRPSRFKAAEARADGVREQAEAGARDGPPSEKAARARGGCSWAHSRNAGRPKPCSASCRGTELAGRQALCLRRRGHPAAGGAVRKPRFRPGRVQRAQGPGLLPRRRQIISPGTSRAGARPAPTAKRRGHGA